MTNNSVGMADLVAAANVVKKIMGPRPVVGFTFRNAADCFYAKRIHADGIPSGPLKQFFIHDFIYWVSNQPSPIVNWTSRRCLRRYIERKDLEAQILD